VLAGKLALLAGSLCLVFLLLELLVRFSGFTPLAYLHNGRESVIQASANPDMVYELVPGAQAVAWGTEVHINEWGYRGEAILPGSSSPFRVVVLGDSITFGNFIAQEDTYSSQLGTLLQETMPGADVINLGVGGYDTLQEVAIYEHLGHAFQPDMVVIGYCLNDIAIASANLQYIERFNRYRDSWWGRSYFLVWVNDQLERIRMRNWLVEVNNMQQFRERYADRMLPLANADPVTDELIQQLPDRHPSTWYREPARLDRLRYALDRLGTLTGKTDTPVLLVIFPWMELDDDGQYPHAIAHALVRHEAERFGFDVLDLTAAFQAAGMQDLRIREPDPVHPNPEGHRIAAELLKEHILQQAGRRP